MGGMDGPLTRFSKPDGAMRTLPIQHIKAILETREGEVFVAGRYGVYKIGEGGKEFQIIEQLSPNKNRLAYSTINAIEESGNGMLVLATNGAGLLFYNRETQAVQQIDIQKGMPSDIVQGILQQDKNNYWASTSNGLAHLHIDEKDTLITVYDKRDGLTSTEFNYGSYARLRDGRFAFGGIGGVTIFDPGAIYEDGFEPLVAFEQFKIFNKKINPGEGPLASYINVADSIKLKHSQNSIEIGFTGILQKAAAKVKYSWMLENFDKRWSVPSTNNTANYTNLSPGDYLFKVKASNKYGEFGPVRELYFHVSPPWYATTWAYILYLLLTIVAVLLVIYFTSIYHNKKNAENQVALFNNITHELKTPLSILMTSLENSIDNASAEKNTSRLKSNIKHISSLFEQMLNFHKVTSQRDLEENINVIRLDHYFNKLFKNFGPLLEERNLDIEYSNDFKTSFHYNEDAFNKVVLNLISNAIKYSHQGGKIEISTHGLKQGYLQLVVKDHGMGIPKSEQKHILKKYYRARNAINSQKPGTGLGLLMAKRLIEKTGGTIVFESEENKGTSFTVYFKDHKEQYEKLEKPTDFIDDTIVLEQEIIDQFSDSKILIVEDNDDLREVMIDTLGRYFQVYEASNGKEGYQMALEVFPDLILTDLIMPEMDGNELALKINEDINLNHIPVFMLTVLQNSTQKLDSIKKGVTEYIEKPVNMKLLMAKMINTLKWQHKLRKKYIEDGEAEVAMVYRNKNDQEFLEKLEQSILDNVENNSFSVHDLSANFGMSRTSLYNKLKNLVDLSPQDFIIHTKLKKARQYLIEGEMSIKEIAYACGFSNPKYFSTSFKKFYGSTPTGFVEGLRDKS